MSDSDDLRMRIAQACRVLGRLDLAQGLTGHVSARIPGTSRILIRARGPGELGVRYTEEEQISKSISMARPSRITSLASKSRWKCSPTPPSIRRGPR